MILRKGILENTGRRHDIGFMKVSEMRLAIEHMPDDAEIIIGMADRAMPVMSVGQGHYIASGPWSGTVNGLDGHGVDACVLRPVYREPFE